MESLTRLLRSSLHIAEPALVADDSRDSFSSSRESDSNSVLTKTNSVKQSRAVEPAIVSDSEESLCSYRSCANSEVTKTCNDGKKQRGYGAIPRMIKIETGDCLEDTCSGSSKLLLKKNKASGKLKKNDRPWYILAGDDPSSSGSSSSSSSGNSSSSSSSVSSSSRYSSSSSSYASSHYPLIRGADNDDSSTVATGDSSVATYNKLLRFT
jgi:hypothetical protein